MAAAVLICLVKSLEKAMKLQGSENGNRPDKVLLANG